MKKIWSKYPGKQGLYSVRNKIPCFSAKEITKTSLTFLFTRNPFTHLVSAYNFVQASLPKEKDLIKEAYMKEIQIM